MTFDMVFVLVVAGLALVLFATDRIRVDQLSMAVPVVLLLGGVIGPREAFAGLSSDATVTVAAMLVLGLGLSNTGLVSAIAVWARTAPLGGKTTRMFALCALVALLSPFLNNTAVVIVFIPVFLALAEQAEEPASLYLMPLSFMAIMGGTVTLIGTSTNLIVHGEAVALGFDELNMFSIAPLGIIYLVIGTVYLFTIGRRMMPARERAPDLSRRYGVRRYIAELQIGPNSSAVGRSLPDLRWQQRYNVTILGLERDGQGITLPQTELKFKAGDILYAQGAVEHLAVFVRRQKLFNLNERRSLESIPTGRLVELLVGPGSALVGQTLRDLSFAQRFNAAVMGVQHHSTAFTDRLANRALAVGDILLVRGQALDLQRLAEEPGILPLAEVQQPVESRPRAAFAAGIMVAVIVSATTGIFPISTSALAGAALMVFTGCVQMREVYQQLDWMVVFIMAGLIPLGLAMGNTGAVTWLATGVVDATSALGETGIIAAFYLLTAALTAVVANTATAVMLTPVAIAVAATTGLNPYALLVAVMFGASASFVTPFGYKTNVMIYSVGGYRFMDFVKVGGMLNLLLALVAIIAIPILWPS